MEVKKGYKQTQVGVIPEDWKCSKLRQICEVIRGASPRPKGDPRYYGGAIPRLMVEDVTRDGKTVFPCIDFLTEEGAKRSRPCKKGTLTIVCSGTVGIASFLGVDACIHDGFLAIVRLHHGVFGDYLYYQLCRLREHFDSSATHGGIFTNLTTFGVREFAVPIAASLAEQEAIAGALSDADAWIESLEQLIAKKRQIKQGAMQELLTGKRRLPGFSGQWETKRLGDVLRVRHGKSQKEIAVENGRYPILASGGEIGRTNTALYSGPSVLIGRKGTIDAPQYSESPFWSVDTLFFTEVDKDHCAKWFYYRFCLVQWRKYNEASGVPSLNARTIEAIELALPELKEQTAIATVLSDMDTEIGSLESKLAKAREIKQGMMQELLTGKIRLV